MGKYKFIMRTTKPNKEGLFSVNLEISKNGKREYISLKIYGDLKYWDANQERFVIEKGLRSDEAKKANQERKNNNDLLERYNLRAKNILLKFEEEKIDWTQNQFKNEFLSKVKQGQVYPFVIELIERLNETDHSGNANCYKQTLHMLSLFDKKIGELVFGEINVRYVNLFDAFLQKRKCCGNTRRYYIKALRAIYNKAIKESVALQENYPFGKSGFNVSELGEETTKRYLIEKDLDKLKTQQSTNGARDYARKLFLFSYYCYGISFVDMAHLKIEDIQTLKGGSYIIYKREKTKTKRNTKSISIKISDDIQILIDDIRTYQTPIAGYLLPIVSVDADGNVLYNHIRGKNKKYNDRLKELAKEFKIEFKLTSYVSRHTMAMQLQGKNIPREIISQVLGHSDLKTTNTYLDSLDNSVIDEAVKVL